MQTLFRVRGRTVVSDLYGRLPSGDRAVGFAEIPAGGRAFTLRASIPDAEHAALPAVSIATAMLR